jgi:hypothetical protein
MYGALRYATSNCRHYANMPGNGAAIVHYIRGDRKSRSCDTQRARRFGEGLLARDLGKTHATKIAQTPQLFRREISAGNSWYADGKIFDFIPVLVCSLLQIRHRRLVLDLSIVIDSNHFLYINRHVTKHFMNIATLIGLHYKVLLKAYFSASGFPSTTHITTPDRPTGAETNIVE